MHYPDLGSASHWLCRKEFSFIQSEALPRSGSARHQYGISVLVTQTSFCEGSSGDLAKRRLFSQAMFLLLFRIVAMLFAFHSLLCYCLTDHNDFCLLYCVMFFVVNYCCCVGHTW